MRRAVFLDRDGTINRALVRDGKAYPPATLAEFELLPGTAEAIVRFRQAGYLVVVVTNQPDVATGRQSREMVEAIHAEMGRQVVLDDIRVCFHVDRDGCACRKPRPGMLLDAARAWTIDLAQSWMVGDRWRDVDAGRAAGCRTCWIRGTYDERPAEQYDAAADSLLDASALIIGA